MGEFPANLIPYYLCKLAIRDVGEVGGGVQGLEGNNWTIYP